MNIVSYYTAAIGACDERLGRLRRATNAVSVLRLVLFASGVAAVWVLIRSYSLVWVWVALGSLAAFIGAVNWYFRLKDQRLLWEKQVFVNANEWAFLQQRPNGFPDGGAWLDGVIYGDDLDIYGPRSLYHALNRTTTTHGAETLAGWLGADVARPAAIRERQEAVKVLAGQADLRRMLTAKGLLAGGGVVLRAPGGAGDLRSLKGWLESTPRLYQHVLLRVLVVVMTVVNGLFLVYGFSEGNYEPLIASVLASWVLIGSFAKYVHQQHELLGRKQAVFGQYADILAVFSGVEVGAAAGGVVGGSAAAGGSAAGGSGVAGGGVSVMLEELRGTAREAHGAIRRLSRLSSMFDQRLNMVASFIMNSMACYDLQCMIALERWKAQHRTKLPAWIAAVGSIEALNSLATFAFNNPGYVYPVVAESGNAGSAGNGVSGHGESGLMIEAAQLAHPLIPAERRIANDFRIGVDEKLILVTGSNMSGKTTFLRTVGVNLVLAQCGSPVCATAFTFTPMQVLTSLRISDSLPEQTSYFMAELKKLQQITALLGTGAPTLVLIDEILRGTNSEDKTYGSEQFARRLAGYRCLSLFATHDLALGALETEMPRVVANYCFESVIENGDLRFDYRLQRGIARNRNASFLMKKMGII